MSVNPRDRIAQIRSRFGMGTLMSQDAPAVARTGIIPLGAGIRNRGVKTYGQSISLPTLPNLSGGQLGSNVQAIIANVQTRIKNIRKQFGTGIGSGISGAAVPPPRPVPPPARPAGGVPPPPIRTAQRTRPRTY
jgi:hypothetical protein